MKILLAIITLTLALIGACSQGYIVNTELKTNYPEGRELYISKCNSCHQLYSPNKYTEVSWDSILTTMKMKAKTNDEQTSEIYNWILEAKTNKPTSIIYKE